MPRRPFTGVLLLAACALPLGCGGNGHAPPQGLVRAPSLVTDPRWQGLNNRGHGPCRTVEQNFGWHRGRVGGLITRATRPAFYAAYVNRDFDAPLSASGGLVVHGVRPEQSASGAALVGFFRHSIAEWRAPDSLAMRVSTGNDGGGDYTLDVEYGSHHLRAGGAFVPRRPGAEEPQGFRFGERYPWELTYTPQGDRGLATLRVGSAPPASVEIPAHVRHDRARFDRFGLATPVNGAGQPMSLDLARLTVDGVRQDLRTDPRWDARNNRSRYRDCQIGPQSARFGWTGPADRRIGGIIWRTDERYPAQRAFYADRTRRLTLEDPLFAKGTFQLRHANTDSAVLLGWFDAGSNGARRARPTPPNFLGVRVDGPTRSGIEVTPTAGPEKGRPRSAHHGIPITPGRRTLPFTLSYDPRGGHTGRIVLTLGKERVKWKLPRSIRRAGARFDRFGLRSLERGGSWQEVYLGDLRYTIGAAPRPAP
jgi:hypothetical protein